MASGSLPQQTPPVPAEMFNVVNDLYLYLRTVQPYMKLMDVGLTGTSVVGGKTFTVKNGIIISIV